MVLFLESAELRVKNRQDITMRFWRDNVDRLLEFQDKNVLRHVGQISHEEMEAKVKEIYAIYDKRSKTADVAAEDLFDLEEMKALEDEVGKRG